MPSNTNQIPRNDRRTLFFWVGSFFREDNVEPPERVVVEGASRAVAGRRFVVAGVAVVLVAAVWPPWAGRAENYAVQIPSTLSLPAAAGVGRL